MSEETKVVFQHLPEIRFSTAGGDNYARKEVVAAVLELIRAATAGQGFGHLDDAVKRLPVMVAEIEKSLGGE